MSHSYGVFRTSFTLTIVASLLASLLTTVKKFIANFLTGVSLASTSNFSGFIAAEAALINLNVAWLARAFRTWLLTGVIQTV